MKKYVSQKPCKFGDKRFNIGEEIPADLVAPDRVPALLKYGVIVTVDAPDEQKPAAATGGKKAQK